MNFIVRAVPLFLFHPLLYSLYVNIRLQQLSPFTMKAPFWCSYKCALTLSQAKGHSFVGVFDIRFPQTSCYCLIQNSFILVSS